MTGSFERVRRRVGAGGFPTVVAMTDDSRGVHLRSALDALPAYTPGRPAAAQPGVTTYKISSNENPYPPLPGAGGPTRPGR